MITVAIPHWRGRVSPVFDVAGNVLLVRIDGGAEAERRDVPFESDDPRGRAARLAECGADVLICGAISRPLEMAVTAAGLEVIPQTCGDVETVLAAYMNGGLKQDAFLMPGCCGRRRRFRGGGRRAGRRRPGQPDRTGLTRPGGRRAPDDI